MTRKNSLRGVLVLLAALAVSAASGITMRRPGGGKAPAAQAAAADTGSAFVSGAVDEPDAVSDINIADASIDLVLMKYSKLVNRSVIKDPGVVGTATITFTSRPGQKLTPEEKIEALRMLLEMNGVHVEDYGEKFVRALPRKDVRKEGIPLFTSFDDPRLSEIYDAQVVTVNIPFKNITVDEAQKALEGFKSSTGLFQVFERINSIYVTDTKLNISHMVDVAKSLDIARPIEETVETVQIKYAAADEIASILQKIVDDSQKWQEQEAKARLNASSQERGASTPRLQVTGQGSTILNRPAPRKDAPAETVSAPVGSIVASMSEASRGIIRGRVQIIAEPRTNRLIITTNRENMEFFKKVIEDIDIPTTPDIVTETYRLNYAEAEEVVAIINDIIGNANAARSSSKQNQNQNAKAGTSRDLSRGTTTSQQSGATRSGEGRTGELTKDNTIVRADKRLNAVVVVTLKELQSTVKKIIESLDIRLSQVLIETCIIEVTLGDGINTGVDWVMRGRQHGIIGYETTTDDDGNERQTPIYGLVRDGLVNNGHFGLGGGGGTGKGALDMMLNVVSNAANTAFFGGATPIGSGINYLLKSDKLNLAAIIQATKTDSHAKYIASPIVMTVDNKDATIGAFESRKFFSGYETSTSYSTYVRTPKYENKDIGIKIKVKPKINPNGTVMLNIEEEYTQLGAGQDILVDGGSGGQDTAHIDTSLTRNMTADAILRDRQTVVLGGLTEKFVSESETGIPILKDIPLIGKWLFGSVRKEETRKELLVFMTPYVVNDSETAERIAERLKNSMSDARPWDSNGWSDSPLADPMSYKESLRRMKESAKKQDEDRKTKLAVEKWKMDRAKTLEKQDEDEQRFWLELKRKELDEDERKRFDEGVKLHDDIEGLMSEIRRDKLDKAQQKIDESAAREKTPETPPAAPAAAVPETPAPAAAAPAADVLDELVPEAPSAESAR